MTEVGRVVFGSSRKYFGMDGTKLEEMGIVCTKHGVYGTGICCLCERDDLRAKLAAAFNERRAEREGSEVKPMNRAYDKVRKDVLVIHPSGPLAIVRLADYEQDRRDLIAAARLIKMFLLSSERTLPMIEQAQEWLNQVEPRLD